MNIPTEYFIFKVNVFKKIFIITTSIFLLTLVLGQKDFAFGFLVGGLLSFAIFSLLYKYILVMRGLDAPQRKKFITLRMLIIYAIMALALFIGIKKGITVFLGTAAGIFSLKIAIFIQVFGEKRATC